MDTMLLSESDIKQVMTEKDVVEIVDKTYQGFGEGKVVNPAKIGLDLGEIAPWAHIRSAKMPSSYLLTR